jgi:hypothetical protein
MTRFHEIKLEFIRPGPPHNQLLSPLTPYMALSGEGSPVTFHIDIEHHHLLSRLERLRYVTTDGRSGVAIPSRIREATVAEIGEDVARILDRIRTLLGDEWRAVGDKGGSDSNLVHIRLVLSGSELALLPFEMAFAPQAFPGEGLEWTLQFHMPVVPTREIRRTRPNPVAYDRPLEPRILLVSAAPGNSKVPLALHVQALRNSLEPWIRWPRRSDTEISDISQEELNEQRLEFVKERLRVLPDACIEDIYETCSKQQFTHIHILAHGDYDEVAGEKRFGIALCAQGNRNQKKVVSGKRLAKALQAESEDGSSRSIPLMVTLATCDSGNPGSILIPGGSIAHDLHSAGIPWVFASQFPLTKIGSVRMAESLYPRILRGDDPRLVLYEVRRQLYMHAERDHDWASLVVYSTVPNDFDDQVMTFFERQTRRAINVCLDRADDTDDETEMESALDASKEQLKFWRSRLPEGDGIKERVRRSECYGIHGSTWKRISLLWYKKRQKEKGRIALLESLTWYRRSMEQWAMDEDKYHWVATQALCLTAVLQQSPEPATFLMARQLAERDLAKSDSAVKAWAHGTMAELEMLASYHMPSQAAKNAKKRVCEHCKAIVDLMGEGSFHVDSTRRQFQRYLDHWCKKGDEWQPIAKEAVRTLSVGRDASQLPPYA